MDECLDEYIETAQNTLQLLRELVDAIAAHHNRCNGVKVVGTTASVAGSLLTVGCIIAAPFTGGTSIVALTGLGSVTAMAGAVTNLGTDAVDMIWTKKYQSDLVEIDKRLQCVAEEFAWYMNQIEAEAARIFIKTGNERAAIEEAFQVLVATGNIGFKGKQVRDIGKNMGRTTGTTMLRNGGKVWKGMRVNSNLLMSACRKMGLDISKRAAFNVVKGATVVVGAVFIVWDIKSLADSLTSDHPAAEPVKMQIKNIEQLLENLKELRNSFYEEDDD
ncbi:unnamed protein product [Adineta ricciae]|uniref:Uncharacterized protein n=1 Tax=Adineta ricciae TaxID=249248 RepID=A0A815TPY2_ADIRI|nr:unnamed protein product [Adineta ricciae]CAF1505058.1 unnamed protein product [Adineta ricciae]